MMRTKRPHVPSSSNLSFVIPINSHEIVPFVTGVGKRLERDGHSVKFIPQHKQIARTAKTPIQNDQLDLGFLDHEPTVGFESLCEKYEIESPRQLVFPQMVYNCRYDTPSYRHHWLLGTKSLDYDRYQEILHRSLDYFDRLYEHSKGGIPLQYQGAEVIRRTLQRVADYHGHQSVRTSFSPVPNKVLLRSKEEMLFPKIEAANYDEMTPTERQTARDFRESVIDNQKEVMGGGNHVESVYQSIRRKARRIQQYKEEIFPVASDWFRRKAVKPVLGRIAEQVYMDEQSSREFIGSHRYIFYPIQYFRESRVTMRAPEFYNQLWLIEYLSRSLPQGYALVVKDHPNQTGAQPLSHVRAINRYSNAISPSIPARQVINHADAVVTLNNTVGYEALMFGKPVLTLGDAFYSEAGYTRDVSNSRDLPRELNKAVSSEGISDEDVIEFSHGILQSSYEGIWGDTSKENIDRFVNSIERFVDDN